MRLFLTFFAVLVLGYIGLCVALYVFQRSLIYYPQLKIGMPAETIKLSVAGLDVLVTTRPRKSSNAVIYFGGNGEDVSYSLPALATAFPDHALYLLHYRGYGGSGGAPSEEGIQQDALSLFDKVQAEHSNIIVMGRSLGSGVAVRLADQRPASRLVLVTPYDSLQDLAAQQFRFFPVKWLLIDKFESSRYAPRIKVPTLIIAAEHDEVIPRASTEQLYARFAAGVASIEVIPGTGHNTISEHPRYVELLRRAL